MRIGDVLKKGKEKKIKPNSKPKNVKGTDKRKTRFEENEPDLPTDIDEDELL
jgi:hypothetical protein